MRRHAETRIVVPLDVEEAVRWSLRVSARRSDDEVDWIEAAELTRSLRAIKSGRGTTIALLVGAIAALVTALVVLA